MKTLILGAVLIALLEGLLFCDVRWSGRGALHTSEAVDQVLANPPAGALATVCRWVAVNFTALVWPCYIVLLDGVLVIGSRRRKRRSPVRERPHQFALLCLASIPIWCLFDFINFYLIDSWKYLGVPPSFLSRVWGYVLAFGSILPGMLLSAQVYLELGVFDWARIDVEWTPPRGVLVGSFVLGLGMFFFPLVHHDPVTNLTLWTSLVFLLDPINCALGRPSMLGDWFKGNFARTLALFAGGLTCGLLWEFWNYWALAKWVYHLPFLGSLEKVRYFEMPLPGLLGFIPFGVETWIIWQTVRIAFDGLAEELPDDRTVV